MLLVSLLLLWPLALAGHMRVEHSWSQVDYVFPNSSVREQYIASGQFVPLKIVIIDADVYNGAEESNRKIFVTLPSLKSNSPATLAMVTNQTYNNTTLLQPYPDWSWYQSGCDGITSVFRTAIDECGRLWVLDTGVVEAFANFQRKCPPQILVFDLKTDKLIRRHRFPASALKCASLLITIAVDTRNGDCGCSFAYVADVEEYAILVYDFAADKSWRVTNPLFYPDPLHGDFHVNGVDFQLMDGVFGLALGPVLGGDRTLYFHCLASLHESWVRTSVLRNSSLFSTTSGAAPSAFRVFPEPRASPAAAHAVTSQGVLLFSLPEDNAIGCWYTRHPYSQRFMDIVAKDDITLQFQSGLKVYGDHVWTVSNRLQNFIVDQVAENEVNIRLNVGKVSDLIRYTDCDLVEEKPQKHLNKHSPVFSLLSGLRKLG